MTMAIFSEDKRLLSYESMKAFPNVTCFTTTRFGGVSEGNYSSLNCGIYTDDDPEKIKQNLEQQSISAEDNLRADQEKTHQ